MQFHLIYEHIPFILEGVKVTFLFAFLSLFCGLPLGILLGFLKSFNRFSLLANGYTAIFRGTPLLVQLGLIFYATPQITGYTISAFEAGIITFSLNSAAYSSEIIRAGIQAIPQGQWEVAKMLGLSKHAVILHIIMPQVFRNILPALANETINLLKETALVSTIGEADILQRSKVVAAEKFLYFEPLIIAAILYFLMVNILGCLAKKLEKRVSYARD